MAIENFKKNESLNKMDLQLSEHIDLADPRINQMHLRPETTQSSANLGLPGLVIASAESEQLSYEQRLRQFEERRNQMGRAMGEGSGNVVDNVQSVNNALCNTPVIGDMYNGLGEFFSGVKACKNR